MINLFTKIFLFELLFLIILKLLLSFIPHIEHELIYYININLTYIISILCWISFKYSKINRTLTSLIAIWFTTSTPYTILFIFSAPNFSESFNYYNFHVLFIYLNSYQLFLTLYLFFLALFPGRKDKYLISLSIIFSIMITIINFSPIFISGVFKTSYDPLFSKNYNLQILNFSLLIVFWYNYIRMKLIFSEYLSNVLSIYTVIVGIGILHSFSAQNELLFHYFAQYFNFILYFIIVFLFFIRINYLKNPKSKINEDYVKNYYILRDFVDKPRRGLLIEFYTSLNKNIIYIFIGVMIFLGVYLFFFDRFTVFIRLNILLLVLASIISIILSIITWHKRWYHVIGIFFKKRSK
jgi:hypothetical protein